MSRHAARRAKRWGITVEEIAEALADREWTRPGDVEGRLVVMGYTLGGRRLKVVVLAEDEGYVVTCAVQGRRR